MNRGLGITAAEDMGLAVRSLALILLLLAASMMAMRSLGAQPLESLQKSSSSTSASLMISPNVQIDTTKYLGGTTNVAGVEPYVAVGADGTIHVAWIEMAFSKPATYYDQGPTWVDTGIYYSYSRDGGRSFSEPIPVNQEESYGDPSIALAPNGDVLIAYISSTYGASVAAKSASSSMFHLVAHRGIANSVDRPWIAAVPNGDIYLIWNEVQPNTDLELGTRWSVSKDVGRTFSPQSILTDFPTWPTGMIVGDDSTVHVVFLSWSGSSSFPDQIWYANKRASSSSFQTHLLSAFSDPYSLDNLGSRTIFLPGPALAVDGSNVFVLFSSNFGKSLLLRSSSDGGASWTGSAVIRSSSGLMQMPWVSTAHGRLLIDWLENSGGYWNTYCGVYQSGVLTQTVKVSDQNGYSAEALNFHGDFTSNAFLSQSSAIVVWSDGRSLPNYYGYGHIYSAVVQLNLPGNPVPELPLPMFAITLTIGLAALVCRRRFAIRNLT